MFLHKFSKYNSQIIKLLDSKHKSSIITHDVTNGIDTTRFPIVDTNRRYDKGCQVQVDIWKKMEHKGGRSNIQVFGKKKLVEIKWGIGGA